MNSRNENIKAALIALTAERDAVLARLDGAPAGLRRFLGARFAELTQARYALQRGLAPEVGRPVRFDEVKIGDVYRDTSCGLVRVTGRARRVSGGWGPQVVTLARGVSYGAAGCNLRHLTDDERRQLG